MKSSLAGLLTITMLIGLPACTKDDSNTDVIASPSANSTSPCDDTVGYQFVPADLPDGDTVGLISTGIPVEQPPAEGFDRRQDGSLIPAMEETAFLLVGLPQPEGTKVPEDLVSAVSIMTFDAPVNGAEEPVNCTPAIDASVSFISSDYLPMWEIQFESSLRDFSMAQITAPGVDRLLAFDTQDLVKFPYPEDGELASQPQFVAERVYREYFDSK